MDRGDLDDKSNAKAVIRLPPEHPYSIEAEERQEAYLASLIDGTGVPASSP